MSDKKQTVIDRFPELASKIHRLFETKPNFNALCHEYGEVTEALHRLEGSAEAIGEAQDLRRRRADLDEAMLAMMQQSVRI